MFTSASRSSYSPESRVRTSIASMSSRSFFSSASASARLVRPTLFGGQLVQHGQVVEPLPEFLDPAQLALRVRQLACDLLGPRLVIP
jgi:hypothetical protein